jgi:hypothetical protein
VLEFSTTNWALIVAGEGVAGFPTALLFEQALNTRAAKPNSQSA